MSNEFDWLVGKTIIAVHLGLSGEKVEIAFSNGTFGEIACLETAGGKACPTVRIMRGGQKRRPSG